VDGFGDRRVISPIENVDLDLNASFTSFEILLSEIHNSNLANLYKGGKIQKDQTANRLTDALPTVLMGSSEYPHLRSL
jgi:hypothetical protein